MTKWAYALQPVPEGDDVLRLLNAWGTNGWEAWHIREGGYKTGIVVTIYFRRPIQEQTNESRIDLSVQSPPA